MIGGDKQGGHSLQVSALSIWSLGSLCCCLLALPSLLQLPVRRGHLGGLQPFFFPGAEKMSFLSLQVQVPAVPRYSRSLWQYIRSTQASPEGLSSRLAHTFRTTCFGPREERSRIYRHGKSEIESEPRVYCADERISFTSGLSKTWLDLVACAKSKVVSEPVGMVDEELVPHLRYSGRSWGSVQLSLLFFSKLSP